MRKSANENGKQSGRERDEEKECNYEKERQKTVIKRAKSKEKDFKF